MTRDEQETSSKAPEELLKIHSQTYEPTGVPHLDDILGKGLARGALTLIMGVPGSGKTTIASQIAFSAASRGQTALILTALSESTSKLIEHLRSFDFFDPSLIGGSVQFLSLQQPLTEGLQATRDAVMRMARQIKANIVVLDGFRGMREVESHPWAARQFLYDLSTALGIMGTTTVVTSETDPRDPTFYPETTTADVILGIHYDLKGGRQRRFIEVIKARGVAPMSGVHTLVLTTEGAHVYPQFEERVVEQISKSHHWDHVSRGETGAERYSATEDRRTDDIDVDMRVSFGLPMLDSLLHGGIIPTTSTVAVGSIGVGKTLLALHFALAGIRSGEKVVYLSLRETPQQLLHAASPFRIGPELRQALAPDGGLSLFWMPPIKLQPDIVADRLLTLLDSVQPSRLVVDSVAELEYAVRHTESDDRVHDYLSALLETVHLRGITALFLKETAQVGMSTVDFSADPLSVLAENMLILQQVAYQSQLHRVLSVLKQRYSAHDTTLREYVIEPPEGIRVLAPLESGDGVLEGILADRGTLASAPREQGKGRTKRPTAENMNDLEQGSTR